MQPIEFTDNEKAVIENALNLYWHDAYNNLQKNDLGDIERKNYEYQLKASKALMNKIDNHY